jgi:hypothetical protein
MQWARPFTFGAPLMEMNQQRESVESLPFVGTPLGGYG